MRDVGRGEGIVWWLVVSEAGASSMGSFSMGLIIVVSFLIYDGGFGGDVGSFVVDGCR